jgi:membrane-bound lytic murein transglycosylase D
MSTHVLSFAEDEVRQNRPLAPTGTWQHSGKSMHVREASLPSPPSLRVNIRTTPAGEQSFHFTKSFRIGRGEECEICVTDDYVSRVHAEVVFEEGAWHVHDLNSSNGIYVRGQRLKRIRIAQATVIRLGVYGTEVSLEVEPAVPAAPVPNPPVSHETIVARYVEHYFGKSGNDHAVGQHTVYLRKAFAQVQTKQRRRYGKIIAVLAVGALSVGVYAFYLHQQVQRQRATARELFYAIKSLDLDISNLEQALQDSNLQQGGDVIRKYESRRREMEKSYEQFLATLHVYDPKMTEQHRLVLRIARIFGECELDMPPDFEAEINRHIKYWQSSGRLATAVRTAERNGYTQFISQELLAHGLPPQFFYLALQESNFDPYVNGPMTRKGIAKGMWQFVPETAAKYGLHLGPLVDLRRPDPGDERDQYQKETRAAAAYLKDLYSTDAQASGLLVMACYNWGEDQVLPLVRGMPANPSERNFWRLLSKHRAKIPQETYEYVFYIASAAVIGENPRLFGFDFDNPLASLESK